MKQQQQFGKKGSLTLDTSDCQASLELVDNLSKLAVLGIYVTSDPVSGKIGVEIWPPESIGPDGCEGAPFTVSFFWDEAVALQKGGK